MTYAEIVGKREQALGARLDAIRMSAECRAKSREWLFANHEQYRQAYREWEDAFHEFTAVKD